MDSGLFTSLPPGAARLIDSALDEDLGTGDHTTSCLVRPGQRGEAVVRAREGMVLSGVAVAAAVFHRVNPGLEVKVSHADGSRVQAGEDIMHIRGALRSILTAERVALNFVGRLSGIATTTRRYVDAVQGLPVKIVDTRKTTPLHRSLEKEAVRAGGGYNHRFNLSDGILIKDNHIAAAGSVREAMRRAREGRPHHLLRVEIEVDTLDQLRDALEAGADVLLLDNFSVDMLRAGVALVAGRALTEASGGVTLDRIRTIAETGVDMISVGGLIHKARWMDVGLDVVGVGERTAAS